MADRGYPPILPTPPKSALLDELDAWVTRHGPFVRQMSGPDKAAYQRTRKRRNGRIRYYASVNDPDEGELNKIKLCEKAAVRMTINYSIFNEF